MKSAFQYVARLQTQSLNIFLIASKSKYLHFQLHSSMLLARCARQASTSRGYSSSYFDSWINSVHSETLAAENGGEDIRFTTGEMARFCDGAVTVDCEGTKVSEFLLFITLKRNFSFLLRHLHQAMCSNFKCKSTSCGRRKKSLVSQPLLRPFCNMATKKLCSHVSSIEASGRFHSVRIAPGLNWRASRLRLTLTPICVVLRSMALQQL